MLGRPAWRAALKLVTVTRAHAEKHYEDLKDRPFFPPLCEYSACPISARTSACASASRP